MQLMYRVYLYIVARGAVAFTGYFGRYRLSVRLICHVQGRDKRDTRVCEDVFVLFICKMSQLGSKPEKSMNWKNSHRCSVQCGCRWNGSRKSGSVFDRRTVRWERSRAEEWC